MVHFYKALHVPRTKFIKNGIKSRNRRLERDTDNLKLFISHNLELKYCKTRLSFSWRKWMGPTEIPKQLGGILVWTFAKQTELHIYIELFNILP